MSQNGVMARGDVHKSVHAKCWSWNDADVWRHEQLERRGRCKLRHPLDAKLNPERHSQGGVVDSHGQMWLESRMPIEQRDKAPTESHAFVLSSVVV